MEMDMDRANKVDAFDEGFLNMIGDLIALVDADGAIHEDGKVDHKVLPKTVRLSGINPFNARHLGDQPTDLLIQRPPREGVHQVIG